jgi:O-antigen/teichoic acid export membrane protein
MDSRQTPDERRAGPTGTEEIRKPGPPLDVPDLYEFTASSTPSGIGLGMRWREKPAMSADSTVFIGESHRVRAWRPAGALLSRVRRDSLMRNSLFIMSTTVVNSALGFVFWILAARLFTAHDVGLTAAIVSASTIVVLLASLGVGGMLIQTLPRQGKPADWSRTFWAGMATAMATSLVIGCAAVVLLSLFARQLAVLHSLTYATLFVVGTVALTAGTAFDYIFIAERTAGNMLTRNSIVSASKVLIVVLFSLVVGSSALNLLGAWAGSSVVGLGFGIVLLIRRVRILRPPKTSVLVRTAVGLRSRLAGNQLIGMGASLLPYLLPLLVTAILSPTDNAYFYTTWMMAGMFLIISPALSQALFAEGTHSPHDLRAKARSALTITYAMLIPCVVGVFAMGGIMLSAFGPAYEQHALGLLRIVLLASIPDAVTNVYVAVLRVRGRLVTAAGLNLGMGAGTVALCWVLLPVLGISAVGWAFLAMQLCGCLFVILDLRRSRTLEAAESSPKVGETV